MEGHLERLGLLDRFHTVWKRIGVAGDVPTIWSLAVDPSDPGTLFAGTRPAGVYRSHDGGAHRAKLI